MYQDFIYHALGYLLGKQYHGIKATVNVWAPNIAHKDDFSNSQIWVISDVPNHDLNVIEAGWMVYPGLFGDNSPRLFIYWTNDGFQKSGCYNLLCSGFVQTSNEISVGAAIAEISTYSNSQFNIDLMMYKDPETRNWWLSMDSHMIGYWPSALIRELADHATMIQFGGEVFDSQASGGHTSTQMGSGHFPGEGFGKASFIKNIELVDGETTSIPDLSDIILGAEKPSCYDVTSGYNGIWDNYIFFGGPGNNPQCP
ncbi:putative neprosin [Helianthus annuus]|nr:putative neprosin [Helianthus annuus]